MKDLLVHLDAGARSEVRLEVAVQLAERCGARLNGLFAQTDSDLPATVARRASEPLTVAAQRSQALFEERLAEAGLQGRWWRLSHGEPGHVVGEMVFCARFADLAILGQHQPETRLPEELIEQVVLSSGRPVLVLPHAGAFGSLGQRVTVAWNASREASRALHDALPLLVRAAEVTILAIRDVSPIALPRGEDVPSVDIVAHLAAHGVKARLERLTREDIGVMDLLLSRAFDLGSDLLVMGAHAGLGFLRGSGTRFILRHMTLPVLMSN